MRKLGSFLKRSEVPKVTTTALNAARASNG